MESSAAIIGHIHLDPDYKSSSSKSFLIANRDQVINVSGIEMVTIHPFKYTSLKDLIQTSPSPSPSSFLISSNRLDSWREIAIKDPLVKQAAKSYLQPMLTPMEVDNRSFVGKLKDECFGCFGGVNDAVVRCLLSEESEEEEAPPEERKRIFEASF